MVSVTKPAINLRGALPAPPIHNPARWVCAEFANLITNGEFSADSDWTKGTGWTIGGGTASHDGSNTALTQTGLALVQGRTYLAGVTTSGRTTGTVTPEVGGTAGTGITTNASTSEAIVAGADADLAFAATGGFDGDLDNAFLYEADPSDDAAWYRLPRGMRVKDGGVQRGQVQVDGVILFADEYEQIERNGQFFIKPDVAPGVSTRTGIWGYFA